MPNFTFEYDQEKSLLNKKKHGISFEKAQELWFDSFRVEIKARTFDENRYLVIGLISNKLWCAVITYRNQKIRIISVRRARHDEEKLYKSIGF